MLRGSSKYQDRVLMSIGAVVLLCVALAVSLIVVNPFGGRPKNQFSIAISDHHAIHWARRRGRNRSRPARRQSGTDRQD
jgi:hypothetical protein